MTMHSTAGIASFVRSLFLAWSLTLLPGTGFAESANREAEADEEVAAALATLQERMADLTTVQAEFEQRKQLTVFGQELVIVGRLAFEAPGRFAWHVEQPVRYAMVIEGDEMRHWDEDTDRVQRLRLDRDPAFKMIFEQMTVWFSGRYANLPESYRVEIESREPYVLRFQPRTGSVFEGVIEQVRVGFRRDERYIERLEIVEGGGDRTTMIFQNTQLNQPIAARWWRVDAGR